MSTAAVHNQGVFYYLDEEDRFVGGPGIDVVADSDAVLVSAVGWEVTSSSGRSDLTPARDSPHPHAELPLHLSRGESARWMMTKDEIVQTLSDVFLLPAAELDLATLRPFAIIDGLRVRASDAVPIDRPVPLPHPRGHEPGAFETSSPEGAFRNLEHRERRVTSQNGEDGVIDAIFETIGTTNKFVVEFGCGNAVECNGANLVSQGWSGLFMDPFCTSENPLVEIYSEFVTAENIELLLEQHRVPQQLDMISIDVDGNDFWIWKAMQHRPRLVVIEYNPHVSPQLSRTIRYDPEFQWNHCSDYYGASLRALDELGRRKGYTLVHCENHATNAFFIADECLPAGFEARPLEEIYRRPNILGHGYAFPTEPTRALIDPFSHDGILDP